MSKLDMKIILDDVRSRDAALLTMLLATDRQAMALFRVYVTLTVALASAALAGMIGAAPYLGVWVVIAAGTMAGCLTLACWYCIQAIKTATVALPGKGAEFWQWASRDDVTEEAVIAAYLEQSLNGQDNNFAVNQQSSSYLRMAKRLGVASIVLGSIIVVLGASGLVTTAWEVLSHP
ncbi:hypothetical protein [Pseudochrobactrum lubricantis]|uniref:hypothetical protein n=1 Tax=Pseudochrobactrum lubricantis TaxID=558172 RepID=UPI0035D6339C